MPKIDKKKLEELKKALTPEQYDICFRGGTEVPFTGELTDVNDKGTYSCVVCDTPLFLSQTKFHSGTGWPSFWAPVKGKITEQVDHAFGMTRTEVRCKTCGAHLGHVFKDGPDPTGLRYCINSKALTFKKNNVTVDTTGSLL